MPITDREVGALDEGDRFADMDQLLQFILAVRLRCPPPQAHGNTGFRNDRSHEILHSREELSWRTLDVARANRPHVAPSASVRPYREVVPVKKTVECRSVHLFEEPNIVQSVQMGTFTFSRTPSAEYKAYIIPHIIPIRMSLTLDILELFLNPIMPFTVTNMRVVVTFRIL